MLSIIVAVAENDAIGRKNELLWHLSEDLKYFKSVTTGHPVIMGRKTYESIGRPLPGRRNIVVSRSGNVTGEIRNPQTTTLEVAGSLEEAFALARGGEEFFVIGGGQIYNQAFARADRLYITKIEARAEDADTFFPEVEAHTWKVIKESDKIRDAGNGIDFRFVVYERIG